MAQHSRLAGLAIATILLGPVAFAQTIDQLDPGASGSAEFDQLNTIDRRDAEEVHQIAPADGGGIGIAQPTGRDLCDPSVAAAVRRAAGVNCQSDLAANGIRPRTGIANDPLLTPRDKRMRDSFDSLGLGDDVPATVILQPSQAGDGELRIVAPELARRSPFAEDAVRFGLGRVAAFKK